MRWQHLAAGVFQALRRSIFDPIFVYCSLLGLLNGLARQFVSAQVSQCVRLERGNS